MEAGAHARRPGRFEQLPAARSDRRVSAPFFGPPKLDGAAHAQFIAKAKALALQYRTA